MAWGTVLFAVLFFSYAALVALPIISEAKREVSWLQILVEVMRRMGIWACALLMPVYAFMTVVIVLLGRKDATPEPEQGKG